MGNVVLSIAGALLLFAGVQTWRLDKLQDEKGGWEATFNKYQESEAANLASIATYQKQAEDNKAEAERFRLVAEAAAIRVERIRAQLEARIEDIQESASTVVVSGGCPAVRSPGYLDWVRNFTAGSDNANGLGSG